MKKSVINYKHRVHIVKLNLYIFKYSVFWGVLKMYKLKDLLESL